MRGRPRQGAGVGGEGAATRVPHGRRVLQDLRSARGWLARPTSGEAVSTSAEQASTPSSSKPPARTAITCDRLWKGGRYSLPRLLLVATRPHPVFCTQQGFCRAAGRLRLLVLNFAGCMLGRHSPPLGAVDVWPASQAGAGTPSSDGMQARMGTCPPLLPICRQVSPPPPTYLSLPPMLRQRAPCDSLFTIRPSNP